jgi:type IV pilus assembly protein PilA
MRSQSRGFTLIELMIVVAIIAILSAIALPVLARNQARAAESACLSEMKSYVSMSLAAVLSDDSLQAPPLQACSSADTVTEASTIISGSPKFPGTRRAVCTMANANCRLEP